MTKELKRKIRVDFYKESGKWYAGGDVLVEHYLFQEGFKQDIVNNQNILYDGWQGNYIVVTNNHEDDDNFAKQVFLPSKFYGIQKTTIDNPHEDLIPDTVGRELI